MSVAAHGTAASRRSAPSAWTCGAAIWRARDYDANGVETCRRQGPAGIAPVLARDLTHQGQAQPRAGRAACTGRTIEGRKNALALLGRNARAVVGNQHRRCTISAAHVHRNPRSTVLLRTVDTIRAFAVDDDDTVYAGLMHFDLGLVLADGL